MLATDYCYDECMVKFFFNFSYKKTVSFNILSYLITMCDFICKMTKNKKKQSPIQIVTLTNEA